MVATDCYSGGMPHQTATVKNPTTWACAKHPNANLKPYPDKPSDGDIVAALSAYHRNNAFAMSLVAWIVSGKALSERQARYAKRFYEKAWAWRSLYLRTGLVHDWVHVTTTPSLRGSTELGTYYHEVTYTCSRCGDTYVEAKWNDYSGD